MDRTPKGDPPSRTAPDLNDRADLRDAIIEALEASPLDEQLLRDGIWNYVGAERDAGVSPGRVILAISEMAEAESTSSSAARGPLVRNAILWGVEAYFGYLGGDVFSPERDAAGAPSVAP